VTERPIRWYKSKVDWWLAPLLAIPPVAALVSALFAIRSGDAGEIAVGVGAVMFVAAIYGGVVFPMRYGIGDERLTVRFGLIRQHVELADIVEVRPTRNPLSSPALSLDRLHIQYGRGFFKAVMISPALREEFLADLADSAGLHRVGNRLER
jgi:hypothetical protein